MKKHLKIRVGTLWNKKFLQIIEQTHRWDKFGDNSRVFCASNNFYLESSHTPQVRENYHEIKLFVRGIIEECDMDILPVPSEEWLAKLRVAVKEYNQVFSGEPEKTTNNQEEIIE